MSNRLRPNGLLKTTVYLRKDQYLRLRAEELDQAVDEGGGRPDISRRIRGIIDLYQEAQKAVASKPASRKRTIDRI